MTNTELWTQYQGYSQDTSTIARSLGFGAIAICWLFKEQSLPLLPSPISAGLKWAVLFFISDLAQYFISTVIYRIWIRRAEIRNYQKTQTLEGQYEKPTWLDWPAFSLWYLKLIFLFFAYLKIASHVL